MNARPFPPQQGWLTPERVEYLKNLLQLVALVLAMPWLLRQLWHNPGGAARRISARQVGA